jgi:nitrate reductase alpha subunit
MRAAVVAFPQRRATGAMERQTESPLADSSNRASKALLRWLRYLGKGTPSEDGRVVVRESSSRAEEFYRDRWRHDKEVRSTHGVNCTGSCSWMVYVRDGII